LETTCSASQPGAPQTDILDVLFSQVRVRSGACRKNDEHFIVSKILRQSTRGFQDPSKNGDFGAKAEPDDLTKPGLIADLKARTICRCSFATFS
jgi:hypothetical protein